MIRDMLGCAALFLLLGGCASDMWGEQDPAYRYIDGSYPVYAGGDYGQLGVGGEGASHLDPWLSGTEPGQRLILAEFDRNHDGRIGVDRAGEANRWFRRFADRNHDLRLTDAEINRGLIVAERKLRQRGY